MNVAILGVEQASQGVAYVIENGYNVLLKGQHAETLNVVAFIALGINDSFIIGDKAVLNLEQFIALYHKKVIEKIILKTTAAATVTAATMTATATTAATRFATPLNIHK